MPSVVEAHTAEMCLELEKLAFNANRLFLAYLLELARTEAFVGELLLAANEMKRQLEDQSLQQTG